MSTLPAGTYEEPHWRDGKMRTRCLECDKVVFPDEQKAKDRAAAITASGTPMKHYQGRLCLNWHLSRKRPRRY